MTRSKRLLLRAALLGTVAASPLLAMAHASDGGSARTLGPTSCDRCHTDQIRWWRRDPHRTALDPFLNGDPDYLRLMSAYGGRDACLAPTGPCARCHATAITDRGDLPVRDGVGCESCHGPAERWFDPHKSGDKALGRQRPGFVRALTEGLVDMDDPFLLATTCTRCHYVTDRLLVSRGHRSGRRFDFPLGVQKVKHWDRHVTASPEELGAAIARVKSDLGELPQDTLVFRAAEAPVDEGDGFVRRRRPAPVARPAKTPPPPPLVLESFPIVDSSLSIEERLRRLARRIEYLRTASELK